MFESLLSFAVAISSIIVALYAIYQMRGMKSSIHDLIPSLDDWVWEEEGEWKMDARLGKLIDGVGSRLALSMRQSMFQKMGVDAKLQKGVDKAIGLDFMDSTGIGGILDMLGMGNTKQILARNPKTLQIILQRIAPFIGQLGKGGVPSQGYGHNYG